MGNPSFDAPRARFSVWFKTTRKKRNLSASAAARELGVDPSAIIRWEHGKALPMTPLLRRLSMWGSISAERLITMLSEDIPLDPA
jgi:transcriptional regulator with XRE-family HTH domain